ncbi:MAG: fibronectin type III domain-containing protein, partial [Chitinophagales bacterium]|nr:fibronectin type III domain-containing protein [Chitinophagales bacterium]
MGNFTRHFTFFVMAVFLQLAAIAQTTFTNPATMTLGTGAANNASLYPSPIVVSGLVGIIGNVTVSLPNCSHTFPDDLDIMLVAPNGDAFYLISDCNGGTDWVSRNYTISDAGATNFQNAATDVSGTYRPTNIGASDVMTGATPTTGANPSTAGTATFASVFGGDDPNGTWNLYVRDGFSGDGGSIIGWSITITVTAPPTCGAPTSLVATPTSTTAANLTWSAPVIGPALTYNWEVRTSGAGGSGAAGLVASGSGAPTSASVSGLSSGATYNLYVQSDCGISNGTSTWAGPSAFTMPTLANDFCGGAVTLVGCSGSPQSVSGTTTGSLVDAVYTNCGAGGSNTTERGVWYKYVGDNNAVTMNTCNATGYDSRLTVYSGTCGAFTCVAQNDDMGAACASSTLRSQVTFNANLGTDYYIFVHGYQTGTNLSAVGNFVLSYSCTALCLPVPSNETCASASAYGALPTSYTPASVSNNCASAAAAAPTGQSAFGTYPDIWYSFVYPTGADAVVRVDLNGTATNVGLEIYGSCGGAPIANVASVTSGTAYVTAGLGLVAGQTYFLQLYSTQAGRGTFNFGLYYEPCATPLDLDATNITSSQADLSWTSSGTLFDIELGAFGFTPTGNPTANDIANPHTYTGLAASTQYTYYVRQDCGGLGTSSWNGPFSFTTSLDCSSIPSLSSCGSAFPVAIAAGNGAVDITCAFSSPGSEVYYSYTPSVTGSYSFTNSSSGGSGGTFDYVHAYFKDASGGCDQTGWTSIWCDFLANDGVTSPVFPMTAGTQYYFLFDGETTNAVNLSLTLDCPPPPPANDTCAGAIQVSCGSVVTGNTLNSSVDGPATDCNGFSISADNWYTILGTGADFTVSLCN